MMPINNKAIALAKKKKRQQLINQKIAELRQKALDECIEYDVCPYCTGELNGVLSNSYGTVLKCTSCSKYFGKLWGEGQRWGDVSEKTYLEVLRKDNDRRQNKMPPM